MKPTEVTTGVARLSYVHVFSPYAYQQGQEPKYSTTILIPKTDIATKQRIDAAIEATIQAGTSEKWSGQRPPKLAIPVHDGDGVRPSDGMPFGAECKGHWVFTASSKQPVAVVDQSLQHIINQSEIYSGIFARVSIAFFAYNSNGKKGIGCGLNGVQKISDGEPLGGGISPEAAFGGSNAFSGQAPAPVYPQQSQPQYAVPAPIYPQPQPVQQEVAPIYPQQPQYVAPMPQVDLVTGMPVVPGGVMGL